MSDPPAAREDGTHQNRPAAVLFAYSWDLILAIVALFGALVYVAAGVTIGTTTVNLPLVAQIVAALASVAYAALLITVAALLTRPRRWVRRVQILTMALAIAFAVISIAVGYAASLGIEGYAVLGNLLFVLLDTLVIVVMTERRVVAWYREAAQTPRYVLAIIGVWAAGSCVLLVLEVVLRVTR